MTDQPLKRGSSYPNGALGRSDSSCQRLQNALTSRAMWVVVSALSGMLAVAMGAFGAHALRNQLEERLMEAYSTAVLYHLVHSVALLALALFARAGNHPIHLPAGLFSAGILLFSGSLYVLALSGARPIGMITPLGGVALLLGWLSCAWLAR